jgi:serine/threonine protein kinase
MTPEDYLSRQDVGPHSDIFAIVVTLYYYLVSRRMPFHADNELEWMFTVAGNMEEQAPWLSDVCPDVSAGFSDIIAKGLQKKIPQRYANAADMKRDLEEHIAIFHQLLPARERASYYLKQPSPSLPWYGLILQPFSNLFSAESFSEEEVRTPRIRRRSPHSPLIQILKEFLDPLPFIFETPAL